MCMYVCVCMCKYVYTHMYLTTQTTPTSGYYNYHGVRVHELTQHQFITHLKPWFDTHVHPGDYHLVSNNIVWFRHSRDQLQFILSFSNHISPYNT